MSKKLYIGNLDYETTNTDLTELFAGAGQVVSANVIMDRDTRRSKGFAFVEMSTDEEAHKAITLYHGQMLNGRALVVNAAREQERRAPGSQGSYGGYGRDARGGAQGPRFRDVKHKSRGGAKQRRY